MRNRPLTFVLAGLVVVVGIATASAQQIRFYPDFTSVAGLQMNGTNRASYNGQYVLRLTSATPSSPSSATTWFTVPQVVNSGFTTYFRFQIHNAQGCCNPGDGFAFMVQNATYTDSTYRATGSGITARGVGDGGLGYAGIPNSLAVEFDTTANVWDPSIDGNNHVAVQGCGTHTNGPVHTSGRYTIGSNNNVTSCLVNSGLNNCPGPNNCGTLPPLPLLGVNCGGSSCADGSPHDVVIEYDVVNNAGTLKVYVDPKFIANTHTPVAGTTPTISISYNIDNTQNSATGISLAADSKGNKTLAYVGFTASQTREPQAEDILAWEFTPHAPAQVQQTIPPGGTPATYSFGANDTDVTYFPSFVNQNGCDGLQPNGVTCLMTVQATPISRLAFWQSRLKGTPFAYEQCVVYQGTGGNCVVYTITCQNSSAPKVNVTCPSSLPNTCNNIGDPGCIQFSTSYYTTDGINMNNADYLKADPIGSNSWTSIFQSFSATQFDPRTSGSGGTSSDFVATFAVGAKP